MRGMEQKEAQGLKVFIASRDVTCEECGKELGRKGWIFLTGPKAICLACADLDHLVFLPAGDTALTRRAKKHSRLSAVVLKWSKARKQYERQGLLVEESALDQAETECLADAEAREARQMRAAERRERLDEEYVRSFARRIRELYPGCPPKREYVIAEHACLKYSGRVGRSAPAKDFDENAIRLAVAAHIRHSETEYDSLLNNGDDRHVARAAVRREVDDILADWQRTAR